jgi:hypothetical protein
MRKETLTKPVSKHVSQRCSYQKGMHTRPCSEALCRRDVRHPRIDKQGIRYVLRCTMPGPDSSYSCFEHQRFWNVLSDARIEPPIHTEYLRSGGATILTFMLAGESAVSSFCIRSPIPGNMVVPPERTTFPYKSRRTSRSHLKMELYL